jgi:hypothetical protein
MGGIHFHDRRIEPRDLRRRVCRQAKGLAPVGSGNIPQGFTLRGD